MKKLLLSLVGILCSMSLWAQTTTGTDLVFGIKRDVAANESSVTKAQSGADVKGFKVTDDTNVVPAGLTTVALAQDYTVWSPMTDKARAIKWNDGSATKTCYVDKGTKNYRNTAPNGQTATELSPNNQFAFTLTITPGYVLTIKSITGDVMVDGNSSSYQMIIQDNEGTDVYTSQTKNIATAGDKALKTVNFSDLASDIQAKLTSMTGTVKVILRWTNTAAAGKYCIIKDFNIVADVADAPAQTKYSKPTITQGAYDQPSGTYSVTIDKADGEDDGVISYKIGDGDYQTYSAAISVAPNTTVTAKVTGSTYSDSDEKEFTTSGKPQLATPTYTIGAYNFDSNTYSITLAAAQGNIYYTTDNWTTFPQYRGAIDVVAGTTVKARALQNNMTNSADLVFDVPAAPCSGEASTPMQNTYTDGMEYRNGLFIIPSTNSYIGGYISGGTFNNYIKMRVSRGADPDDFSANRGFHIHAAPGVTLTSVTLNVTNNYGTNIQLSGVYVDNETTTNLLPSPIAIAGNKATEATEIPITGISATDRVVFVFTKVDGDDEPNQIRALISATGTVARDITLGNVGDQGYATLSAPQNFTVTGAKAYKAAVAGNVVNLTELTGVIPAGEGVIVAGEKGATVNVAYVSDAATADMAGNELQGTTSRITTPANCMALNATAGEFQSYTGAYFPANKAYLVNAAGAKNMRVVFGNTTGIKAVNAEKVANAKFIENGRVVIVKDGAKYNVAGQVIK